MKSKIFSIHIPKTAGTTFQNILKNKFDNDLLLYGTKPLFTRYNNSAIQKINLDNYSFQAMHGHFLFDELSYNSNNFHLTWLRNPIERVISHYYFWKNRPNINMHPIEEKIKYEKLSLEDFCMLESMQNVQLYFIGINNVKKLDFIGITEEFDNSLNQLSEKLSLDLNTNLNKRDRVNSFKEKVSLETRSVIREFNILECDLYKEILNNRK